MESDDVHGHLQQVSGFKDVNIEYVELSGGVSH